MQPNESLYEQKPEVPSAPTPVVSSDSINGTPKSFASRFEYMDNMQPAETSSSGPRVLSHVSPPKSSDFFGEYGMSSAFSKKMSSNSSKIQVSYV